MDEQDLQWANTENDLKHLLANERWIVSTAADAQEQSQIHELLLARIKRTFDSLAEDAWKYRDLQD